jgi:hypothetical protein
VTSEIDENRGQRQTADPGDGNGPGARTTIFFSIAREYSRQILSAKHQQFRAG